LLAGYGVAPEQVDVVQGEPAAVIAQTAAERRAALVVIGALRRSQLEQAMIGSTAEAVALEVPCDVLLVPAPAHESASTRVQGVRQTKRKARATKPRRRAASSAISSHRQQPR
jgi:hypothetical protein